MTFKKAGYKKPQQVKERQYRLRQIGPTQFALVGPDGLNAGNISARELAAALQLTNKEDCPRCRTKQEEKA